MRRGGSIKFFPVILVLLFAVVNCSEKIVKPFVFDDDPPSDVTVVDVQNDPSINLNPVAAQDKYPDGLVALEKIKFKKNVTLNGNASVIGICKQEDEHHHDDDEGSEEIECKSEIKIDKDVVISGQSTLKADKIKIEKNAIISGRLEANHFDIKSSAQAPNQNPLSTIPILPPFFKGSPGSDNVNESTTVLAEGNYNELKLKKNTSIEFSGGYYHFNNIEAKEATTITCKTTCIVLVKGKFEIGKNSSLLSASGNPNQFYFYVESLKIEDDDEGDDEEHEIEYEEVEIGKDSNVVANFYAPYSELEIKKNTQINGILIAKEIEIDKGSSITSFGQTVPLGNRVITATSIDIQQIQFIQSDGGIQSVTPTLNPVDLFTLEDKNNLRAFIGPVILPENNYTGIKLILGSNNTITVDGATLPLQVFNNDGSTNSILLSGAFALRGGRITEITLEASPDNSIIQPLGQILFLRPVVNVKRVRSFTTLQESAIAQTSGGQFIETLVNDSTIIAVATPGNPSSGYFQQAEGHNLILTDYAISIEDTLKDVTGNLGASVIVSTIGGHIGDFTMTASGTASLTPGQRIIVFIQSMVNKNIITGGRDGKINF